MAESTIVEILNPMTTFNNTDYDELALVGNNCVTRCCINFNCRNDFSLTNPEYTSLIFLSFYPEFKPLFEDTTTDPNPYLTMFNKFATMANHSLNAKRFGEYDWEYLMSAFIAHYLTLFLQKVNIINSNVQDGSITRQITAISNQSIGLATKESLGGEEIQIENMLTVSTNKEAGLFMTTPYGQEFWDKYISYARNFIRGVY